MPRKPKFRPVITRVKLNPEQAVLACACYDRSTLNQTSTNKAGKNYICTFSNTSVPPKGHCWVDTTPLSSRVMT
ncbi:MAG: hypothetical protein PHT41_03005 [Candidatus Omnitrophica bacterium]|nr:hypothetical protein [Candidatus Omnitrophota bacterium]MDD5237698.1 hypothetical protein [Candidatus Omnitrophota bacterium]